MTDFPEKDPEFSEEIPYYLEITATIRVKGVDFPSDDFIVKMVNDVRKKVFCSRESHKLVDLKTRIYEGAILGEEGEE